MKHNQNGSTHIIVIGILVFLISAALTYIFLKNINQTQLTPSTSELTQQTEQKPSNLPQNYVEFGDWKVRFRSGNIYVLKLNSAGTSYFISNEELAKTCVTPDTPWLGILQRFEDPNAKQTVGPDAGKTMNQIFGKDGITIDGKLYYFDTTTQFCTRNTSNTQVEEAAKKLESEIKSLEAY